ncbi:DUF5958 family protein [Dyadobacter jiangsuensis]
MNLEEEILINQFGQDVFNSDRLLERFSKFDEPQKRDHLNGLWLLLSQSKPLDSDISHAMADARLKPTYTPCVVLLKHGIKLGFRKLMDLPANELDKVYRLCLFLFRIAYQRRFQQERNGTTKWWYSDLSTEENVKEALKNR